MFQCRERRLAPGRSPPSSDGTAPSGAFGPAKAIVLCMRERQVKDDERSRGPVPEGDAPRLKTIFVWKPRWFVLAQTDEEASHERRRDPVVGRGARPRDPRGPAHRLRPARQQRPGLRPWAVGRGKPHRRAPGQDPLPRAWPRPPQPHRRARRRPRTSRGSRKRGPRRSPPVWGRSTSGRRVRPRLHQSWYGAGNPLGHSAQRIFKAADTILRAGRSEAVPGAAGKVPA